MGAWSDATMGRYSDAEVGWRLMSPLLPVAVPYFMPWESTEASLFRFWAIDSLLVLPASGPVIVEATIPCPAST